MKAWQAVTLIIISFTVVLCSTLLFFTQRCFSIPFVIGTDTQYMTNKHIPTTGGILVCITSGGCNPLDECLKRDKVYTCDVIEAQNYLLELKIAVIHSMTYEVFWSMFGKGYVSSFADTYYPILRPLLSPHAQRFWDKRKFYFDRQWGGLYNIGSAQVFFAKRLCSIFWKHGSKCKTVDEQLITLENPNLTTIIKIYGRAHQKLRFIKALGVVETQWRNDNPAKVLLRGLRQRASVPHSFCNDYVTRLYVTGGFSYECCPEYLKPHNYDILRACVKKITILEGGMLDALRQVNRADVIFPLDHMDCLSVDELRAEAQEMVRLTAHHPFHHPFAVIKCVSRFPQYLEVLHEYFDIKDVSGDLAYDGSDMYMVQSAYVLIRKQN